MDISILNLDFTNFGVIADFDSCDFTEAFNDKGGFTIVVNNNKAAAKYLVIDKIVVLEDGKLGYIDYAEVEERDGKSKEMKVAKGYELKDRADRLIYPAAENVVDTYVNTKAETVIKSILNKNACAAAGSARQIPYLETAEDLGRGEDINYSAYMKDMIPEIYKILIANQMGLICSIDEETPKIIFDVRAPEDLRRLEDRNGGVLLSVGENSALETKDVEDARNYRNLSVTVGQGEAADREVVEVGTTETGWMRRETATFASDATSTEELTTAGQLKIAETMKSRSVVIKYNPSGPYKINEHFRLGDIVSTKTAVGYYDAQITKVITKYKSNGIRPDTSLVLGFDVTEIMKAVENARRMDVDSLKAAGVIGPVESLNGKRMFKLYSSSSYSEGSGTGTVTSITNEKSVGDISDYVERDGYYIKVKKAFTGRIEGLVNGRSIGSYLFYVRLYLNGTMLEDMQSSHYGTTYTYSSIMASSDLIEFEVGDLIKLQYYCGDTSWQVSHAYLRVFF